jgi:hypothetical protein
VPHKFLLNFLLVMSPSSTPAPQIRMYNRNPNIWYETPLLTREQWKISFKMQMSRITPYTIPSPTSPNVPYTISSSQDSKQALLAGPSSTYSVSFPEIIVLPKTIQITFNCSRICLHLVNALPPLLFLPLSENNSPKKLPLLSNRVLPVVCRINNTIINSRLSKGPL